MVKKSTPKITIRMTVDHDWKVPRRRAWVSFKAGVEYQVTQAQRDALVPDYAVIVDGD